MPLPEGTIPVAIGLLIAGISSFAFFRVGKMALGSEEAFQPVISLWFATFALAPGLFLPLEQELGRSLSARRARGEGGRPVVMRVLALGAALALVVTLVIVALGSWLSNSYFGHNWTMVAALVLAVVSYAPAHLSRGLCSGMGRFRSYAVVMGGDGVVRIVLCLLLAGLGVGHDELALRADRPAEGDLAVVEDDAADEAFAHRGPQRMQAAEVGRLDARGHLDLDSCDASPRMLQDDVDLLAVAIPEV